jgi:predicted TIM-barrel fold metal-dependent hydrolase
MKHAAIDSQVVDFGAHFYPPELDDPAQDVDQFSEDEYAGVDRMSDPETVASEMTAAGYDAMVLSNTDYLGHDDVAETAASNDALHEHVASHEAFHGLGSVPIGAGGEQAAAEFERCLEMGLNGGGLHETEVALTDDEMEPVLEVADRTGAPLFVHIPNLPNVPNRLNATYGREAAQQESITRAIHDGLFDRYDDVTIVWHHLGGNIAAMLGRTHLHADSGRWPNQDDMKSYQEFKAQLEEHVYIDTCGFFGYTAPIRVALEEFPPENLLFGTDYPWEPRSPEELEQLATAIAESGTQEDVRRILGENALRVLVNTS